MAIDEHSILLRAPELEPQYHMQFRVLPRTPFFERFVYLQQVTVLFISYKRRFRVRSDISIIPENP